MIEAAEEIGIEIVIGKESALVYFSLILILIFFVTSFKRRKESWSKSEKNKFKWTENMKEFIINSLLFDNLIQSVSLGCLQVQK